MKNQKKASSFFDIYIKYGIVEGIGGLFCHDE